MASISDSSQEANVSSPNISMIKTDMPIPHSSGSFVTIKGAMKSNPVSSEQFQKRRSSSRSIKRRKFDDELVESSLVKSSRARPPSGTLPILPSNISLPPPTFSIPATSVTTVNQLPLDSLSITSPEKRKPRPPSKRVKKLKSSQAQITKDIGRWKPSDDLSLILSVQQTNDLETVFRGVTFSSKFTLQEIQERWYALLYTAAISKPAFAAMKQMHPEEIAEIQAKVLFGAEEEKLIASVASDKGTLEVFQQLLTDHAEMFLPARTAKVLFHHWTLMKQYNLLPDQTVQKATPGDCVLNFSDAEELLDDEKLTESKEENKEEEMTSSDRVAKREIRQLENELPKWQALVDTITGGTTQELTGDTLAVLKGRIVRYLMRSREITLGRSTKDNSVDIDLSLEGPAWKISRRQGMIKMDASGDFFIINEGKKPIFIDGKPVITGSKYKVGNSSVVEISGLKFIFLVNQEMIAKIRTKNTS